MPSTSDRDKGRPSESTILQTDMRAISLTESLGDRVVVLAQRRQAAYERARGHRRAGQLVPDRSTRRWPRTVSSSDRLWTVHRSDRRLDGNDLRPGSRRFAIGGSHCPASSSKRSESGVASFLGRSDFSRSRSAGSSSGSAGVESARRAESAANVSIRSLASPGRSFAPPRAPQPWPCPSGCGAPPPMPLEADQAVAACEPEYPGQVGTARDSPPGRDLAGAGESLVLGCRR